MKYGESIGKGVSWHFDEHGACWLKMSENFVLSTMLYLIATALKSIIMVNLDAIATYKTC